MESATRQKPAEIARLETAYGGPSQEVFGSAVFSELLKTSDDLTRAALAHYKSSVGSRWERYGEAAWMGSWREVYSRRIGVQADIVAELRAIADPDAQVSVPMILDEIEGAEVARDALSGVFDDPALTELRVFHLGDGEAMSGLLVAGRCEASSQATFLVFLMD